MFVQLIDAITDKTLVARLVCTLVGLFLFLCSLVGLSAAMDEYDKDIHSAWLFWLSAVFPHMISSTTWKLINCPDDIVLGLFYSEHSLQRVPIPLGHRIVEQQTSQPTDEAFFDLEERPISPAYEPIF